MGQLKHGWWTWYRGASGSVIYKDCLARYSKSHYKDKTVFRSPYFYSGNSYTGKTAYSYRDNPSFPKVMGV